MAAPTLVAVGSIASGTGGVTPSNPTHIADDILLLFVETQGADTVATPSGGWAAVSNSPIANSGNNTKLWVFWLRATSGAMADPSISDPGDHCIARVASFRGCPTSGDPWDVTVAGGSTSSGATVTIPTVTTTVDDCLIVAVFTWAADNSGPLATSWTNANLTSFDEEGDAGGTDGNGGGIGFAVGELADAGATGATTVGLVTSTTWAAMHIALKPAESTASAIEIELPGTKFGAVLAIGAIHSGDVGISDATWTKVVDAHGEGDELLTVWVRTGDRTAGAREGDVIVVGTLVEQELTAFLLVSINAVAGSFVHVVEDSAFSATTSPTAPAVDSTNELDTVVVVVRGDDDVLVSPPTGFAVVEGYTSAEVSAAVLSVGKRAAGEVGTIDPGSATAASAITGRTWTLLLKYTEVEYTHATYWGPMFPDGSGATFTVPAVAASLALAPTVTNSGALENVVIRARIPGTVGNGLRFAIADDALVGTGELDEDPTEATFRFVDGVTTASDFVNLINASSTLFEAVGPYSPSALLASGDDDFAFLDLEGGVDARAGTPAVYWGPHFPDEPNFDEPLVEATGPETVATLALRLEKGTKVTYCWATDVIKTYSGRESRASLYEDPKLRFEGNVLLLGDETRDVRNALARYAALGRPFLLALPFEDATLTSTALGVEFTVPDIDDLDWANPGQRIVMRQGAGSSTSYAEAVIQSTDGDEITVDDALDMPQSAHVMPGVPVLLDAQQGFQRYRIPGGAEIWNIKATSAVFGFPKAAVAAELDLSAPITASGALDGVVIRARTPGTDGNSITVDLVADASADVTDSGMTVIIDFVPDVTTVGEIQELIATNSALVRMVLVEDEFAVLTGADEGAGHALAGGLDEEPAVMGRGATLATLWGRPVWDRHVDNVDTIGDSIHAMTELVDFGGLPESFGSADVPDWGRAVSLRREGNFVAQFQWLKAFLAYARGRWRSWWLSTYRCDLLPIGNGPGGGTTGQITIVADYGSYDLWAERGYRYLEVIQGSSRYYVEVTGATPSGDTIVLDVATDGDTIPAATAITRLSWLEVCEFESNELSIAFNGHGFVFEAQARAIRQGDA